MVFGNKKHIDMPCIHKSCGTPESDIFSVCYPAEYLSYNININEMQDGVFSVDLSDQFPGYCFPNSKMLQAEIVVKEFFGVEYPHVDRRKLGTLS